MSSMGTSYAILDGLATRRSLGVGPWSMQYQRLHTDPYYLADVTIYGAAPGTVFLLTEEGNISVVLAEGVVASDPFTIVDVPAFGAPYRMDLLLRKGSAAPRFNEYRTKVDHAPTGATTFVEQQSDD